MRGIIEQMDSIRTNYSNSSDYQIIAKYFIGDRSFNKVLDYEPICQDCEYYDFDYDCICSNNGQPYECDKNTITSPGNSMWDCKYGIEQIIADIHLRDIEISKTKIDIHPRYRISTTTIHQNVWGGDNSWKFYDWELIL